MGNVQSETILFRNACNGDLGRAARLLSVCNALTGVLGLTVNQIGGKLSDALGRKPFYAAGPIAQFIAGLICFLQPGNLTALSCAKVLRGIFTTFSGTVMGTAGMRDTFSGPEMSIKAAKAGSVIGLAVMIGPFLEGAILSRMKSGGERLSFLLLSALGLVSLGLGRAILPETLPEEKRTKFTIGTTLAACNPFGFLRIYTEGSPALMKLATITTMQSMTDGKSMSDLGQMWMREHLKLSIEGIRNFIMGFGFLVMVAGAKLTPSLLKNLSTVQYTNLTNATTLIAFFLRGARENYYLYFSAMPFMLPGVNGSSGAALVPVMNDHMTACGFSIGESSAWTNNLRVLTGAFATLLYGYTYSALRKNGINPGYTYLVAGCSGALLPQLIFSLTVKKAELETKKAAKAA